MDLCKCCGIKAHRASVTGFCSTSCEVNYVHKLEQASITAMQEDLRDYFSPGGAYDQFKESVSQ